MVPRECMWAPCGRTFNASVSVAFYCSAECGRDAAAHRPWLHKTSRRRPPRLWPYKRGAAAR